jgi:hypothetical protein
MFRVSFSPSSEAGVQFRQWFNSAGYDVSARALTPYPADLDHCRSCTPASEDGLKETRNMQGRSKQINKLKICALRWSLYNFISKCTVFTIKNLKAAL